ncbi:hypothetical protein PLANPX_0150 [Lacipirellula parvula]|uniref:Uncharacterized protein n=1 Tax=Lacipirellula parvula TaxID=2650471 RepID=A0A5K7X1L5_9BACT|nr:hypothetical protein PLANPX_0150 [Lacipirellula parvula]
MIFMGQWQPTVVLEERNPPSAIRQASLADAIASKFASIRVIRG